MEKLIELLQQIQELAGVAVDALQNAGGGKPEHGGPPHEQGGPPHGGGHAPSPDGNGPPEASENEPKKY
jgi:hypothetical protein